MVLFLNLKGGPCPLTQPHGKSLNKFYVWLCVGVKHSKSKTEGKKKKKNLNHKKLANWENKKGKKIISI